MVPYAIDSDICRFHRCMSMDTAMEISLGSLCVSVRIETFSGSKPSVYRRWLQGALY